MFNSVSSLNQRIEELETHKLHLLTKLKNYGDKGGLEYIVKTQKLENVQSKEFDARVVVEEYDPAANREKVDRQHAEELQKQKQGKSTERSASGKKSTKNSKKSLGKSSNET